ncbi:hypothetical protein K1719_043232 [Acacia pycnantha]|nr:hypothetical protein K1719_043232 [Acacia pycnantha]
MKLILIGFLYLSYVGDPKTLWKWFEPYVKDDELLIVRCLIWYSWTKINLLIGYEICNILPFCLENNLPLYSFSLKDSFLLCGMIWLV